MSSAGPAPVRWRAADGEHIDVRGLPAPQPLVAILTLVRQVGETSAVIVHHDRDPALLTYRAAWQRDQGRPVTREAAMAKMTATEGAQQVIDAAVQLWGGLGVVSEMPVERLYREIRALRIYEGATEVQQLIIARELLKGAKP